MIGFIELALRRRCRAYGQKIRGTGLRVITSGMMDTVGQWSLSWSRNTSTGTSARDLRILDRHVGEMDQYRRSGNDNVSRARTTGTQMLRSDAVILARHQRSPG